MNDFTKEELEYIQDIIALYYRNPLIECKVNEDLLIKLESIIDNYCDHTWFLYISSKGSALRCHKCDKEINGDGHKITKRQKWQEFLDWFDGNKNDLPEFISPEMTMNECRLIWLGRIKNDNK